MHRITNLLLVLLVLLLVVCGLQPKPRAPKPFNTDKALACFEERLKRLDYSKAKLQMLRDLKAIRSGDSTFWEEYSSDNKEWLWRDSLDSRGLSVLQVPDFGSIPPTDVVEAFRLRIALAFRQTEAIYITLEKRNSTVWLTSQILGFQFPKTPPPFRADQIGFKRNLHKKKQLSLQQWNEFLRLVEENEYWDLQGENYDFGFDGSNWTLEAIKNPHFPDERYRKTVHRWSPQPYSAMWKLGQHLLALSGEDFGKIY